MFHTRVLFLCLLTVLLVASPALSQDGHLLPVEDSRYGFIRTLQDRGFLLELNPTDLPYSDGRIASALSRIDRSRLSPVEAALVRTLDSTLSDLSGAPESVVGFRFRPGVYASNNGRLDPVRLLSDGGVQLWEYAAFQFRFIAGPFSSALGFRHDRYYDRDPDGLDSALRWLIRSEDSYIRYEAGPISAVFGRFSRHWGLTDQTATLISSNPRSYDQIGLRIGGDRLSLRTMLGELDSITADGRFTGTAGDDSVRIGSERRYLAAHRLDWRPDRNLVLTLSHATLYSGPNAGLSLKYANPLHAVMFSLDNKPKNDENNGFLGLSIWLRRPHAVFHVQGMLDDADVLNLKEPTSFALSGSLKLPRVRGDLDVSLGISAVAARTYNTGQPEGRYLYLLRGLATQFSDYVSVFGSADWFAFNLLEGLTLTPRLDILWQGERDIRDTFPTNDQAGTILTGTVERTIRPAIGAAFETDSGYFLRLDAGFNNISNANHVSGQSRTKFIAVVEFGFRLSTDRLFQLDF